MEGAGLITNDAFSNCLFSVQVSITDSFIQADHAEWYALLVVVPFSTILYVLVECKEYVPKSCRGGHFWPVIAAEVSKNHDADG